MRGGRTGGGVGGGGGGRSSGTYSGGGRTSAGSSLGRNKASSGSNLGRGNTRNTSSGRGIGPVGAGVGGYMLGRNSSRGRYGGGYGGGRYYGGGGRNYGRGGGGCSGILLVLIIAIIAVVFILWPSDSGVTPSTIEREALPRGSANETGSMYTDNLSQPAIQNETKLTAGMQNFYNKTGVRPHLYIIEEIDGNTTLPTIPRLKEYSDAKYAEMFNDNGAHLLLVFFYNDDIEDYTMYATVGNAAQSVMDREAIDVLMDYIERNYENSSMSNEEMFSQAFDKTGERIMTVTTSPWPKIFLVIGSGIIAIIMLLIAMSWWKKSKAQKNLEAEQTERILGQDLGEFGSGNDAASELEKTYQNGASQSSDIIPVFKSDAQYIAAVRRDSGTIIAYRLANGLVLGKDEAVQRAKLGEIAGVCISRRDNSEFLKSLPDQTANNNLSSLPEF
ncbi:MAG: DUF3892 domain-containing protein [Oscillospiraceae bacterium]|nr:DUF3892 domain-containing protein [Oscillospiraceae bacterium]